MKKEPRDTVNKSLLLNWLSSADENLPVEELNKWLTAKTDGRYTIVKYEKEQFWVILNFKRQ